MPEFAIPPTPQPWGYDLGRAAYRQPDGVEGYFVLVTLHTITGSTAILATPHDIQQFVDKLQEHIKEQAALGTGSGLMIVPGMPSNLKDINDQLKGFKG